MNEEIYNYFFLLKEQLEYTLSNLDEKNIGNVYLEHLSLRVANELRVTLLSGLEAEGIVTFEDLSGDGETYIKGAYIKSGKINTTDLICYSYYYESLGLNKREDQVKFYVKKNGDSILGGGLFLLVDRIIYAHDKVKWSIDSGTLVLYAGNTGEYDTNVERIENVQLHIKSAYRASVQSEANRFTVSDSIIATGSSGTIRIEAPIINFNCTTLEINGVKR